jgi:hypothetical protein
VAHSIAAERLWWRQMEKSLLPYLILDLYAINHVRWLVKPINAM